MGEQLNEKIIFSLDNPPGNEWVLLRSGSAPAEIYKGTKPPEQWLTEETGHIFVRNKEVNEWLGYHRKEGIFIQPPEQWQNFAKNTWSKESTSYFGKIRKLAKSLLSRNSKKIDVFDNNNHINWNKLFKLLNPYDKKRADIFSNGTEDMSESDIINYIKQNYNLLLAGGVNPLEFPELIDEGLRPICNTINQTTWGRSNDGCTGHPISEEGHSHTGYGEPYLRVILDLNEPLANKYINEVEKLTKEWEQKYKNLKIDLYPKKIISSKKKPRVIYYGVKLNIKSPNNTEENVYLDSEECHQISASFFDELNGRVSDIRQAL